MKHLLFIINPCSGTRQARKYIPEICTCFERQGYLTTVCVTTARGDATVFVERYGEAFDRIVCAGGDGTYNETINGIVRAGLEIPVGYIPSGSTNDFANSMHLSSNILRAAKDAVCGEERRMDVGLMGERIFAYVASFGAFTRTSYNTPQNVKNAIGHFAYILEGAREISNIHPEHLTVELEGESITGEFLFGAISNSTSLGGVLTLNPEYVDMQDGEFEVLLIRHPKNAGQLNEILMALSNKRYDESELIHFLRAREISILSEGTLDWSLDGEHAQSMERIQIQNLHQRITLVTPKV